LAYTERFPCQNVAQPGQIFNALKNSSFFLPPHGAKTGAIPGLRKIRAPGDSLLICRSAPFAEVQYKLGKSGMRSPRPGTARAHRDAGKVLHLI
jgi:hypothetical protein